MVSITRRKCVAFKIRNIERSTTTLSQLYLIMVKKNLNSLASFLDYCGNRIFTF